jgi:hypothetical protein
LDRCLEITSVIMKVVSVLVALAVAVAAGVLRGICAFFPWLNLADVVLFLAAGYWVGLGTAVKWWVSAALISLPSIGFILLTLDGFGIEDLRKGIGINHVYSLLLVPLAAGLGTFLGAKRARLSSGRAGDRER